MDVAVPFDPGAAGLVLIQDSPELASHLSFPFYKPIWASTSTLLQKTVFSLPQCGVCLLCGYRWFIL
jgi:hypothetical protein